MSSAFRNFGLKYVTTRLDTAGAAAGHLCGFSICPGAPLFERPSCISVTPEAACPLALCPPRSPLPSPLLWLLEPACCHTPLLGPFSFVSCCSVPPRLFGGWGRAFVAQFIRCSRAYSSLVLLTRFHCPSVFCCSSSSVGCHACSYLQYSAISAQMVRAALKPDGKAAAAKRTATALAVRSWQNGKSAEPSMWLMAASLLFYERLRLPVFSFRSIMLSN